MNRKKLLLLGGTGILSSAICELAVSRQYDVTMINRGRRKQYCHKQAHVILADLKKDHKEDIKAKIKGMQFDAVIDFISYKESELKKNLEIFSEKCSQYIFISSATIYRDMGKGHIYKETDPADNAAWQYCVHKSRCETVIKELAQKHKFEYTIVRPYVTYGITRLPYQISPLKYFTIINRITMEKPIPICDINARCTVTSADDFAVGVVGLIQNEKAYNRAFHITADHDTTWKHIIELTAQKLGKTVKFVDFSRDFLRQYSNRGIDTDEILADKSRDMLFDNTRIKEAVPDYQGTIIIEDKIDEIAAFYQKNTKYREIDFLWDGSADRYIKKYNKGTRLSICSSNTISIKDRIRYYIGKHTVLFHVYHCMKMLRRLTSLIK